MDDSAIRVLNTLPVDLNACNTKHLVRLFGDIAQKSESARALRGKISLSFASVESDPRPNWVIPEVRAFIRKLNDDVPHFPYFLVTERSAGQIMFYLLCLVEFRAGQSGAYGFNPVELAQVVKTTASAVYDFSRRIQDDGDIAAESIVLNLPAKMLSDRPELARKALYTMRPTLEAFRESLARKPKWLHTLTRFQFRRISAEILEDAAALAGIDTRAFKSDVALVEELLRRSELGKRV